MNQNDIKIKTDRINIFEFFKSEDIRNHKDSLLDKNISTQSDFCDTFGIPIPDTLH